MRAHDTVLSACEGYEDHGPHVHQHVGRATMRRLAWHPAASRVDRARVLRWTCQCRQVVYYLVTGGGRAWVRRAVWRGPKDTPPVISETEPTRYAEAALLWESILLGRAR
ncbi:hypothetical protein [Sphaerisporangium sp. TRM90804]|uniref:hypothetical protein n=1 Tax=Sphaerisporangium sp. TRM90804 TaxID=3031113 RepID=UPI002448239C|nr:hypothetical protein [Sphaerisporangium sp. TRM90804]MDH2425813.1 hypothetical protein [Sphaerisporangium sp. TRM90804]